MARDEDLFSIEILNKNAVRTLARDMQKLALDLAGTSNLRKPFEKIRDEVAIPSIDQNFARQGRPRKWPILDPETIEWRLKKSGRKIGGKGKGHVSKEAIMRAFADKTFENSILIFTGKGRRAATAKARFHIAQNSMTYGDWPETTWYMQVHDIAEFAASANIPWRPFALWQKEDEVAVGEILMEWVEERVNKNLKRVYV